MPLEPQEFEAPRFSRHSVHEDGKFFSLIHRPPLIPGDIPGNHFG